MANSFHCTVITPDRQVLDTQANFVALPAHDGEIGILANRAPLVCKLGIGILRVESDQAKSRFYVDGGFAQVLDNNVTVLTAKALAPAEIDVAAAQAALAQAEATHATELAAQQARADAIQRAKTQLALADRRP